MNCAAASDGRGDVLIVGAGPVGMLTANLLGRRGISTLLIDKRDGWSDWSRAMGVMPPALQILSAAGVADEIVASGVSVEEE